MISNWYQKWLPVGVLTVGICALAFVLFFGLSFNHQAMAAQAAEAASGGAAGASTSESEMNASVEPPPEDGDRKQPKATLTVRVNVPQMLKRTDVFSINPYSTAPPKIFMAVPMLPDRGPGLKQKIMNAGYNNRQSMTKPYADSWRWQYCYHAALKKSGITEPHLFFQMYNFADDLMPYVIPEVKRRNKIEVARLKTYKALVESNADSHKDEEMLALRMGLEPVKINLQPAKKGTILETSLFLSPGDWWITGSHKVPGLIYFWQEPIKVHEGDNLTVELNDVNAILIQGGW